MNKVCRVTQLRVSGALLLQNGHRDLGEKIESEVLEGSLGQLTARRVRVVSPVAAGVAYTNHFCHGSTIEGEGFRFRVSGPGFLSPRGTCEPEPGSRKPEPVFVEITL